MPGWRSFKEPLLKEAEVEELVFVPSDGGYGWLVCLGAFISMFWMAGMVVIWRAVHGAGGLLPRQHQPGIPTWMMTTGLAMAPVTSALTQKYNCRAITVAGGVVTSLGLGLYAFMPSLEALFLTLGLLTGLGMGLATTTGVILTNRYFS